MRTPSSTGGTSHGAVVLIDDRPLEAVNQACPRGCIPALDDPRLVPVSEGDYYPDDRYVFAVTVNGEAVALPKNMMEVHEMVNITIGGRRLGIPYCTLCGSAQAYFTDEMSASVRERLAGAETFELRTSGLLSRSNKMMYEFHTRSMFDTFTGQAVTGPLREAGVRLPQTTMVTSRWGEWKEANPHTLIVAEDGGIGRSYPEDPLRGRDDHGPIFPIGDLDGRLAVQEKVLGVLFDSGSEPTAVAFRVASAHATLEAGGWVELAGVTVTQDGAAYELGDRTAPRSLPTRPSGSHGASSIPKPNSGTRKAGERQSVTGRTEQPAATDSPAHAPEPGQSAAELTTTISGSSHDLPGLANQKAGRSAHTNHEVGDDGGRSGGDAGGLRRRGKRGHRQPRRPADRRRR